MNIDASCKGKEGGEGGEGEEGGGRKVGALGGGTVVCDPFMVDVLSDWGMRNASVSAASCMVVVRATPAALPPTSCSMCSMCSVCSMCSTFSLFSLFSFNNNTVGFLLFVPRRLGKCKRRHSRCCCTCCSKTILFLLFLPYVTFGDCIILDCLL